MSSFVEMYSRHPDAEFIIDVSQIGGNRDLKEYNYIFSKFDMMKIKYQKVHLSKYDKINIDNFFVGNHFNAPASTTKLYEFFIDGIESPKDPFRRVFLSRREQGLRLQPTAIDDGMGVDNDRRIDDYLGLEAFFRRLNFEVVTSSDFESFEDQIRYFNEAAILVSTSGSGLTNALFMKPQQTVVELLSPLLVTIDGYYQKQLHYFYQVVSFRKQHVHVNIPNHSLKVKDLISLMLEDSYIGALLDPQLSFKRKRKFWLFGEYK
jgi:hypothetical protein